MKRARENVAEPPRKVAKRSHIYVEYELPTEIWKMILQFCDLSTLLSTLRVSKLFQHVSDEVLSEYYEGIVNYMRELTKMPRWIIRDDVPNEFDFTSVSPLNYGMDKLLLAIECRMKYLEWKSVDTTWAALRDEPFNQLITTVCRSVQNALCDVQYYKTTLFNDYQSNPPPWPYTAYPYKLFRTVYSLKLMVEDKEHIIIVDICFSKRTTSYVSIGCEDEAVRKRLQFASACKAEKLISWGDTCYCGDDKSRKFIELLLDQQGSSSAEIIPTLQSFEEDVFPILYAALVFSEDENPFNGFEWFKKRGVFAMITALDFLHNPCEEMCWHLPDTMGVNHTFRALIGKTFHNILTNPAVSMSEVQKFYNRVKTAHNTLFLLQRAIQTYDKIVYGPQQDQKELLQTYEEIMVSAENNYTPEPDGSPDYYDYYLECTNNLNEHMQESKEIKKLTSCSPFSSRSPTSIAHSIAPFCSPAEMWGSKSGWQSNPFFSNDIASKVIKCDATTTYENYCPISEVSKYKTIATIVFDFGIEKGHLTFQYKRIQNFDNGKFVQQILVESYELNLVFLHYYHHHHRRIKTQNYTYDGQDVCLAFNVPYQPRTTNYQLYQFLEILVITCSRYFSLTEE